MKRVFGWLRSKSSSIGRDRRWISDSGERDRHQEVVAERLARKNPIPVSEAAERLGVTPRTLRRRVKEGKLDAEYGPGGRILGVHLRDDQ